MGVYDLPFPISAEEGTLRLLPAEPCAVTYDDGRGFHRVKDRRPAATRARAGSETEGRGRITLKAF